MQAVSIFIRTRCYKNRKKQVVLVRWWFTKWMKSEDLLQ
jgi:hypothetical protein